MACAAELRYDAGLGQHVGGRGFDLQPHAVFVFLTPDPAHGRTGVTSDQPKPPKICHNVLFYRCCISLVGRDIMEENRN